MHTNALHVLAAALLFAQAMVAVAAPPANTAKPAPASSTQQADASFSREQLDQMLAPVALYPDTLLAQVLMASTYPGDVTDAVAWSKAHPDAKGEEAVRQVGNEPWDPSVQSLVAFPQLLAVLGQDPAWVQRMGDAFLAQPDAVMDSVQRLRRQAEAAGNLKSTEQQKVSHQAVAPSGTAPGSTAPAAASTQTIIIEPSDPEVVYVPSYNPSVIYGTWAYPSYPPYYYPPPPYYYPGGALLSFGIGMAVGGALWGDMNWGHGDIDIDVNRYNNINRNRQIDRSGNNTWRHDAANRDGVPYRDRASREQFGRQLDGAANRDSYRGRDGERTAERDRARQSLQSRGVEAPATSNREARDRAGSSQRQMSQHPGGGRPPGSLGQDGAGQMARDHNRAGQNNNAFSGARNPAQSRGDASRGQRSLQSSHRPASARPQGRPMSRPAGMRGGGGGRRR